MAFRYFNVLHPVDQLRKEMDRVLSGFAGAFTGGPAAASREQPPINVWETADALHAEMEVPGLTSDQLEIAVVGIELSIKIERPEVEEEGVTFHRRERSVGSFTRVVRLPLEVDPGRVEAQLRNGVLTVTLPKAEAARPRKIQVATGQ